ncbi:MAG TPA: Crp/Fnr family transcriptional regulator [Thermoanaerobaculia bacterium]|nr:Crp/Fnr family transcriptional regulator [Thermoanaerobaculia bacterium]
MTAVEDPNLLRQIHLFQGLGLAQLAQLNRLLQGIDLPSGTRFLAADQPGEAVYVILAGTVKVFVEQSDGREVVLAFLGPGDTVGEMSLVESDGRSASAVTTEPSRLLLMDRATFHSCLQRMPPLSYNLVRLLASRLRFANEQIQALSLPDLRCRVARQLSALAERYGSPGGEGSVRIPLRLDAAALAAIAGAPEEQVEPVLRDLEESGCIARIESHVEVRDRQELARHCRPLAGSR